jgi:hypothetical protein
LLLKYNAHINVEICSTVSAVKYLYKYCYKGHDRATFTLNDDQKNDEIAKFLDSRYISASEAIWRILKFDLHQRDPNVVRLPVHLDSHNIVYYNPEEPEEALASGRHTALTRFFEHVAKEKRTPLSNEKLNGNPSAFELLYHEFPKFYVWEKNDWKRRANGKKEKTVGRMYSAHPTDMERFCLRLLLTAVRGPESFGDLRTFDGVTYDTFKQACFARGLLESDAEYYKVMDEAVSFQSPRQLRMLFATILLFCNPVNPRDLYMAYKDDLCEDYKHRLSPESDTNPEDLSLLDLRAELSSSGKNLSSYELPEPSEDFLDFTDGNHALEPEIPTPTLSLDELNEQISSMNVEQKQIFDNVTNKVTSGDSGIVFVDAPGGTGKTFTFNVLLHWLDLHHGSDSFLSMASSGVSSLLLYKGRTTHSTFKVPLEINATSVCEVNGKSTYADTLRKAKVIVWDEVCSYFAFTV